MQLENKKFLKLITLSNIIGELFWMMFVFLSIYLIGAKIYGNIQLSIATLSFVFTLVGMLPAWWPKLNDFGSNKKLIGFLFVVHFILLPTAFLIWFMLIYYGDNIQEKLILGISVLLNSLFAGFNAIYFSIGDNYRPLIISILRSLARAGPVIFFFFITSSSYLELIKIYLILSFAVFLCDILFITYHRKSLIGNILGSMEFFIKKPTQRTNTLVKTLGPGKLAQIPSVMRSYSTLLFVGFFISEHLVSVFKIFQSVFSFGALAGKPMRAFFFATENKLDTQPIQILNYTILILVISLYFCGHFNFEFSYDTLIAKDFLLILSAASLGIISYSISPLRGRAMRVNGTRYVKYDFLVSVFFILLLPVILFYDIYLYSLIYILYQFTFIYFVRKILTGNSIV